MSSNEMVNYKFKAFEVDLKIDLDCFVQLSFSPSSSEPNFSDLSCGSDISASFILGEFKAVDIAKQASDWFLNQYGVQIDHDSVLDFLLNIQEYAYTPFIKVIFDIYVHGGD